MHIHLPKPLHGWREFAGEVGIIVLGVLIALSAEQLVGLLHDRSRAAETRVALYKEISAGLGRVDWRRKSESCISRRLHEIETYLDTLAGQGRARRPSWVGAPNEPLVTHDVWAGAQSTGTLFLLPQDEQAQLSRFYVDFDDFTVADTREAYAWGQLQSLATSQAQPAPSEFSRLRSALAEARTADWIIRSDIQEVRRRAKQLRVEPATASFPQDPTCIAADTPPEQARGIMQSDGDLPFD